MYPFGVALHLVHLLVLLLGLLLLQINAFTNVILAILYNALTNYFLSQEMLYIAVSTGKIVLVLVIHRWYLKQDPHIFVILAIALAQVLLCYLPILQLVYLQKASQWNFIVVRA